MHVHVPGPSVNTVQPLFVKHKAVDFRISCRLGSAGRSIHTAIHTCRSLTDHIRVREKRDGGSVPNGVPQHAESHNGPRAEGPSSAPTSQPAPAPAATQEEARPPEQQERQNQLANYIRSAVDNFDAVSQAVVALQSITQPCRHSSTILCKHNSCKAKT